MFLGYWFAFQLDVGFLGFSCPFDVSADRIMFLVGNLFNDNLSDTASSDQFKSVLNLSICIFLWLFYYVMHFMRFC